MRLYGCRSKTDIACIPRVVWDLGFGTHELLWVLAGPAAAVADRAAASTAVPGCFVTGFLTLLYGLPTFFHFLPSSITYIPVLCKLVCHII